MPLIADTDVIIPQGYDYVLTSLNLSNVLAGKLQTSILQDGVGLLPVNSIEATIVSILLKSAYMEKLNAGWTSATPVDLNQSDVSKDLMELVLKLTALKTTVSKLRGMKLNEMDAAKWQAAMTGAGMQSFVALNGTTQITAGDIKDMYDQLSTSITIPPEYKVSFLSSLASKDKASGNFVPSKLIAGILDYQPQSSVMVGQTATATKNGGDFERLCGLMTTWAYLRFSLGWHLLSPTSGASPVLARIIGTKDRVEINDGTARYAGALALLCTALAVQHRLMPIIYYWEAIQHPFIKDFIIEETTLNNLKTMSSRVSALMPLDVMQFSEMLRSAWKPQKIAHLDEGTKEQILLPFDLAHDWAASALELGSTSVRARVTGLGEVINLPALTLDAVMSSPQQFIPLKTSVALVNSWRYFINGKVDSWLAQMSLWLDDFESFGQYYYQWTGSKNLPSQDKYEADALKGALSKMTEAQASQVTFGTALAVAGTPQTVPIIATGPEAEPDMPRDAGTLNLRAVIPAAFEMYDASRLAVLGKMYSWDLPERLITRGALHAKVGTNSAPFILGMLRLSDVHMGWFSHDTNPMFWHLWPSCFVASTSGQRFKTLAVSDLNGILSLLGDKTDATSLLEAAYTSLRSRIARGTLAAALANVGVVIGRKFKPGASVVTDLTAISRGEVEDIILDTTLAFGSRDYGIITPFGGAASQRYGQAWEASAVSKMLGLESAARAVPLDSGGLNWFVPYSAIPQPGALNAGGRITLAQEPHPDLIAAAPTKQFAALSGITTSSWASNFDTGGDVLPLPSSIAKLDAGGPRLSAINNYIPTSHLAYLADHDGRTSMPFSWYAGIKDCAGMSLLVRARETGLLKQLRAVGGALNVGLLLNDDRTVPAQSPWSLGIPRWNASVDIQTQLQRYAQFFTEPRKAEVI